MRLIKRDKPDAEQEDWKFKAISLSSENKMFLVFGDDECGTERELILRIDNKESRQIIDFIKERLK